MSQKTAFPLPDGVTDAVLNRAQVAKAFGVSENTIDRWIADGMPVHEQGGPGRSYKLQLSDCWAWKSARDHDDLLASEAGDRAVQEMRVALTRAGVGDSERVLSPRHRAELYEAEVNWAQAARARGELAPMTEVEELLEDVFALIRDSVVALPDRLQRECSLNARQVEKAVRACDDALAEAEAKIAEGLKSMREPARTNGHSVDLQ